MARKLVSKKEAAWTPSTHYTASTSIKTCQCHAPRGWFHQGYYTLFCQGRQITRIVDVYKRGLKIHQRIIVHSMPGKRRTSGTRQRQTQRVRKRRRGQQGGILPFALLPLLALAGKAAAAGAISGAAGYGVKKALDKA